MCHLSGTKIPSLLFYMPLKISEYDHVLVTQSSPPFSTIFHVLDFRWQLYLMPHWIVDVVVVPSPPISIHWAPKMVYLKKKGSLQAKRTEEPLKPWELTGNMLLSCAILNILHLKENVCMQPGFSRFPSGIEFSQLANRATKKDISILPIVCNALVYTKSIFQWPFFKHHSTEEAFCQESFWWHVSWWPSMCVCVLSKSCCARFKGWKTRFCQEIPRANRYTLLLSHMDGWVQKIPLWLLKRRCEFSHSFLLYASSTMDQYANYLFLLEKFINRGETGHKNSREAKLCLQHHFSLVFPLMSMNNNNHNPSKNISEKYLLLGSSSSSGLRRQKAKSHLATLKIPLLLHDNPLSYLEL